jgi:hypothetical protein
MSNATALAEIKHSPKDSRTPREVVKQYPSHYGIQGVPVVLFQSPHALILEDKYLCGLDIFR